jgi:hypothetical protein
MWLLASRHNSNSAYRKPFVQGCRRCMEIHNTAEQARDTDLSPGGGGGSDNGDVLVEGSLSSPSVSQSTHNISSQWPTTTSSMSRFVYFMYIDNDEIVYLLFSTVCSNFTHGLFVTWPLGIISPGFWLLYIKKNSKTPYPTSWLRYNPSHSTTRPISHPVKATIVILSLPREVFQEIKCTMTVHFMHGLFLTWTQGSRLYLHNIQPFTIHTMYKQSYWTPCKNNKKPLLTWRASFLLMVTNSYPLRSPVW